MQNCRVWLWLGLVFVAGPSAAQHYVIRLDPENRSVNVRIDEPGGEGYSYETLFPCGSIRSGVWDVVLDKIRGPYEGHRVLSLPESDMEGNLSVDFVSIEILPYRSGFKEGSVQRVPEELLADLESEPLETTWVSYKRECMVGTASADDDPDTTPTFTVLQDGVIRKGVWEENSSELPAVRITSLVPQAIVQKADGTIEFGFRGGFRVRRGGKFEPGYVKENPQLYYCQIVREN